MKFPDWLNVYGDVKFRGKCPNESVELVTFFGKLRSEYSEDFGIIATHIRNEGVRTYQQANWQKAEGMTKGAPDIIIPGEVTFVCEMKRQDHTKSKFQDGQLTYLEIAHNKGAFVCVALGYEAAWEAFQDWKVGCNASLRS